MKNELKGAWKGSYCGICRGTVLAFTWRGWKIHEEPQNTWCSGQESNQAPSSTNYEYLVKPENQNSTVSKADCGLHGLGFQFWQGKEIFFSKMLRPAGTHSASCLVGTRVFLGVKQADMKLIYCHRVPRLSMCGTEPLLSLICLHGVDRENFAINCLSQLNQLVVIYIVMFHQNMGRCHWQFQNFQFFSKHKLGNRLTECLQFHYWLFLSKEEICTSNHRCVWKSATECVW